MRDPRRAYRVVDDFEAELCDYTGSPHCVTVDSATNALFLSLLLCKSLRPDRTTIRLVRHTYVGVLQAVLNAGFNVEWSDDPWKNCYQLAPTPIVDSARLLVRDMYAPGALICLSFHAQKQLPLGRGGAVLTDNEHAADWLQAARMDGRPPGAPLAATRFPGFHCPLPPDTAARGLWTLARWNDSGYTPPPLQVEEYPDLSTLRLP